MIGSKESLVGRDITIIGDYLYFTGKELKQQLINMPKVTQLVSRTGM